MIPDDEREDWMIRSRLDSDDGSGRERRYIEMAEEIDSGRGLGVSVACDFGAVGGQTCRL